MTRAAAFALIALLAPAAARAQTYVPGQAQQRLNQMQLQLQSDQLQQLQRRNAIGQQQPDPAVQMQAQQRHWEIQRQIDETNALAQRMQAPGASPADLNARLQADGARVQQLQQPQPFPPAP